MDDSDVVERNKHHAASLLSRPNPATFVDHDHDVVVTAIVNTQPPPSLLINPHPTPPSELAQHNYLTSYMPMAIPSELKQNRWANQGDGLEQQGGPTQAGVGISETGKHGQVTREVEITVGECTPPKGTSIVPYNEHNDDPSSHRSTLTGTTTIKLLPSDTVLGECNPPPPPHPGPPP